MAPALFEMEMAEAKEENAMAPKEAISMSSFGSKAKEEQAMAREDNMAMSSPPLEEAISSFSAIAKIEQLIAKEEDMAPAIVMEDDQEEEEEEEEEDEEEEEEEDDEEEEKKNVVAQVWTGHEDTMKQAILMLQEFGLPTGLLPLEDVIEGRYSEQTGRFFLKQRRTVVHEFKLIERLVSYGTEIEGYLSQGKIRRLSGVKAKELFLWVPLSDICLGGPSNNTIQFKSMGVTRTFPVHAFAPGQ